MKEHQAAAGGSDSRHPSAAAYIIGLLALCIFFLQLGDTSLPSKDDAYHAQTAKEMLDRGDPIGIAYRGGYSFQSSPLPNWMMAVSYLVFGINEYAARLPSALLALIGVFIIYRFGRRHWGEEAGVAAAFILLTTSLYLRYGRHSMAEVPLAVFCTLALLAFIEGLKEPKKLLLFGFWTGLAILTKSALGLLPIIVAGTTLLFTGRWRKLWSPAFLGALGVAAAVAAVWYVPALIIHGNYFIESHFGAYLGTHTFDGHHASLQWLGLFYYLLWIPIQFMPWTLALIPALWWGLKSWRERSIAPLWLMTVLPIVLLSLITSKYTRYLMPIFPSAALLIAAMFYQRLSEQKRQTVIRWMSGFAVIGIIVLIALPVQLAEDRHRDVVGLSEAIRANGPYDQPLLNLRLPFYEYQNTILFYADAVITQPFQEPEQIFAEVPPQGRRLGVTHLAGFNELMFYSPPGFVTEEVEHRDELYLFSVSRLNREQFAAELQQLYPIMRQYSDDGEIFGFDIPEAMAKELLKETYGLRLVEVRDRARQTFRRMERKGVAIGLAWRGTLEEMRKRIPQGAKATELALSDHMVLFRYDQAADN